MVDRMTAYLKTVKTFSIDAQITRDEVVQLGYKLQHNQHSIVTVQSPNKLRSESTGDIRDRVSVYDGSKLTMYSPDDNVYVRVDAPDSLGKLVSRLLDLGVDMPLMDVLYQAHAGSLTEDVEGGILIGDSTVDGVDCDQVAFRQMNIDWQIWVEQGCAPVTEENLDHHALRSRRPAIPSNPALESAAENRQFDVRVHPAKGCDGNSIRQPAGRSQRRAVRRST